MKTTSLIVSLGLLCATPFAAARAADEEDHAAHHSAAAATAEPAAPAAHDHGAGKPDALQASMRRVEALMQQILEATDPEQQKVLLGQHLQALVALVAQVRMVGLESCKAPGEPGAEKVDGAANGDMQGEMKAEMKAKMKAEMKAKMKGDAKGDMKCGMMKPGGMMKMHEKVEQRIDMLERLLQQTLEREAVEDSLDRR